MNTPSKPATILIVDDTPHNISVLFETLNRNGYKALVARDGKSAIEQIKYARPDLILLDVMMPGMDGYETCRRLKHDPVTQRIPIIFMTALSETIDKVNGFNMGAVDYITKPFQLQEVLSRIHTHLTLQKLQTELREANLSLEKRVAERTQELSSALEELKKLQGQLQAENSYLQEEIKVAHQFDEIVTASDRMRKVLQKVAQVAPTQATVLILGESGTGKELIARAIHQSSSRSNRTFVKLNCATLPANLIESELFGHEKGAFTGALNRRIGRFELANEGTIFLDEIGEMPLDLQAKLLRVLQEGEFERLGGNQTLKVHVRIIAATNRNLEEAIEKGSFREDLYFRLNVFPVQLPPLRDRMEDIPVLLEHFCRKFEAKMGKRINRVPKKVVDTLQSYHWPGNIRELENIIERAVIVSSGPELDLGDWLPRRNVLPKDPTLVTLEECERNHIVAVLEKTNWRVSGERGAAKILDVIPTTLESKMKKLGIRRKF